MLISKQKQNGFSMIEVLVSLLVIGIGLLGLSGLQLASFKSTNNAHSRNVATNLAMELSERMRANQVGVEGGFYENNVNCQTPEPTQCKTDTFCSPEQIARIDVQEIMCGVVVDSSTTSGGAANLLPNSSLVIDHNVDCDINIENDNETSIRVGWNLLEVDKDQQLASQEIFLDVCVIP